MKRFKAAIEAAKEKFLRSKAPASYKEACKKLDIVPIFINHKKKLADYGSAWCVRRGVRFFLDHKPVKIGTGLYFCVIELNKNYKHDDKSLSILIGHEMGHILQIVLEKDVNGRFNEYNPTVDHGTFWKMLSHWFGGNKVAEW